MNKQGVAAVLCLSGVSVATGAGPILISSFDPSLGGSINSIGYDQTTNQLYIHYEYSSDYHVYTTDGTYLRSIPKPYAGGNDDDIEFLHEQALITGGLSAPPGTLISIENDSSPPRVYAVNPIDGTVMAMQPFGGVAGGWVGGAQQAGSIFYAVSWTRDTVQRIDVSSGVVLAEFDVVPAGASAFDVFYGDLDILAADGKIYLVSSSQDVIRVLRTDGSWAGDFDVEALGISGMSGLAFDDARHEAWISSTNGTIYRLGGFPLEGCGIADLAPPFGLLDLTDVTTFITAFIAGEPAADLAEPYGLYDLQDVLAFIAAFTAGCS
ncbi:MAG: hypothetical protein H6810_01905 [Phycisphaeraceae bacterium]|nr:MAG: hypothetical protein H6810_01905 [Phycisphaeraceae bacterium]